MHIALQKGALHMLGHGKGDLGFENIYILCKTISKKFNNLTNPMMNHRVYIL